MEGCTTSWVQAYWCCGRLSMLYITAKLRSVGFKIKNNSKRVNNELRAGEGTWMQHWARVLWIVYVKLRRFCLRNISELIGLKVTATTNQKDVYISLWRVNVVYDVATVSCQLAATIWQPIANPFCDELPYLTISWDEQRTSTKIVFF